MEELDDAWDNLCINPFQSAIEAGRRQGREDGGKAGFEEGYQLGRTTALDYGMEIGFIRGVLTVILEQEQSNARIKKSLDSLRNALDEFPDPDKMFREAQDSGSLITALKDQTNDSEMEPAEDHELDIAGKMERIRARFKLVTVQLGIPHFSLKQVMDEAASAAKPAVSTETKAKPANETSEW